MPTSSDAIDEYIHSFPNDVQGKLSQIRSLIHELVPGSEEHLFYKVPSLTLKVGQKPKDGLMFAAFKNHIGLYPNPEVIEYFKDQILTRNLKYAEGTIQFPLDNPLPLDFIGEIIEYKVIYDG